jgi:hypothetical protein
MTSKPSPNLRLSVMQLLASQDAVAISLATEIANAGQWPQVIDLCRQWKMVSGLDARLGKLGVTLPATDRFDLSQQAMHAFVRSNLSIRAASRALSALEQAGIRCAGFKGIAAIAYLYPGARSRTLWDVDILIEPHDLEVALQILESLGYGRSFPGDLAEYLEFARKTPGAAGNEAMSLTDAAGGAVDLHWRLGAVETGTLLAGIRHATVQDQTLPLLDPVHCMLLCVHHALRNDFVPDDIARDVLDFGKWLAYVNTQGGPQTLHAGIERWGLKHSFLALEIISSRLQDSAAPKPAIEADVGDLRSADRIADLYFHQLQTGPLNTDLTYMASHRPWLQIASGLIGDWRSYRTHMQRSESLNGEPSLTLPLRALRFLRSAARVSPVRWLQLRALAQAKDRQSALRCPPAKKQGDTAKGALGG